MNNINFMKKYLSLFLCLLVLFTLVACTKYVPNIKNKIDDQNKEKTVVKEPPKDIDSWPEERKLLFEITSETGIDFSETLPQKMEWRFKLNDQIELNTIDGFMVVAEATDKSAELVNKFLESKGLAFDDSNVADGVMGGQVGYQKDNLVCTIFSAYSTSPKNNDAKNLSDITVRCGVFNRPIGGDKDANGCLIAAGYSWCEAKSKCLRTWEEECK